MKSVLDSIERCAKFVDRTFGKFAMWLFGAIATVCLLCFFGMIPFVGWIIDLLIIGMVINFVGGKFWRWLRKTFG